MTDHEIYCRWRDIGLLYEYNEEKNDSVIMDEAKGTKLAVIYDDILNRMIKKDVEDQSVSAFEIVYKMYLKDIPIDIDKVVDQLERYETSEFYKNRMNFHDSIYNMDVKSELISIFVDHYDIVDDIISGKHKVTWENNWI